MDQEDREFFFECDFEEEENSTKTIQLNSNTDATNDVDDVLNEISKRINKAMLLANADETLEQLQNIRAEYNVTQSNAKNNIVFLK